MMAGLFNMIRKIFGKLGSPEVALKDKAAVVDVNRSYGSYQDWAVRHPKTAHDIEAPRVDANVAIATRAIADAIMGLPPKIMRLEQMGGVEREIQDSDHEANEMILNPNPMHTWSEVSQHLVKSYLNDGNGYATLEMSTGPNSHIEIWPRDPRTITQSTNKRVYKIASGNQILTYPASRVIHIRDMNPDDPYYGTSRIESVRDEIMMDYFINQFNKGFFVNGAILNVMYTPDHDLTEEQHTQILDAMNAEISGTDNAFKIFVNRFAGKFETTEQTHSEISFLKLLEHNREKIFGVFGLPPFRGGVMEFANYANALAQDLDFWQNTVKPIITVIENAVNKQLLWPLYGTDIRLRYDLDSVPAIRGDATEQIDRLLSLKQGGVVTGEYVREQLGISEDAAPDEPEMLPAPEDGAVAPGAENKTPATKEEQRNAAGFVYQCLKIQKNTVLRNLKQLTANGTVMSVLCDPEGQATRLLPTTQADETLFSYVLPELKTSMLNRGILPGSKSAEAALWFIGTHLENFNRHTQESIKTYLSDADKYSWSYHQLQKKLKSLFTLERAQLLAVAVLSDFVKKAETLVFRQTIDNINTGGPHGS